MRNYVQNGDVVSMTAPHDVQSGEGLLVGELFGVAACNAASGDEVEAAVVGVFDLPKTAGDNLPQGAPVYWDATAGKASAVATDNHRIGVAIRSAGVGTPTVRTRLAP